MIARRKAGGDGGLEALRVLKRRLSDVVYRALQADARQTITTPPLDRGARELRLTGPALQGWPGSLAWKDQDTTASVQVSGFILCPRGTCTLDTRLTLR